MEKVRVGMLGALGVGAVSAFFLAPSSGLFDRVALMVLCAVLAIIWNLAIAGGPPRTAVAVAPEADERVAADTSMARTDEHAASRPDEPSVLLDPPTVAATSPGPGLPAPAMTASIQDPAAATTDDFDDSVADGTAPDRPDPMAADPDVADPMAAAPDVADPTAAALVVAEVHRPGYFDLDPAPPAPPADPGQNSADPAMVPIEATAAPVQPPGFPDLPTIPVVAAPEDARPTSASDRPGAHVLLWSSEPVEVPLVFLNDAPPAGMDTPVAGVDSRADEGQAVDEQAGDLGVTDAADVVVIDLTDPWLAFAAAVFDKSAD